MPLIQFYCILGFGRTGTLVGVHASTNSCCLLAFPRLPAWFLALSHCHTALPTTVWQVSRKSNFPCCLSPFPPQPGVPCCLSPLLLPGFPCCLCAGAPPPPTRLAALSILPLPCPSINCWTKVKKVSLLLVAGSTYAVPAVQAELQ